MAGKPYQDAHAYQQAYLPDVSLKLLCQMTLGKDAPETPAETRAVCWRIIRESNVRLATAPYLKPPATAVESGEDWLR